MERASALFRSRTGQQITLVEDDEQELRGNWTRRLWLPQRPVVALEKITLRRRWEIVFTVVSAQLVSSRRGLVTGLWDWGGPEATAKATYSHGYAEVPDDVAAVVTAWAARSYRSNQLVGVASMSMGPASVTYDANAVMNVGLTDDEAKVVKKYAFVESY